MDEERQKEFREGPCSNLPFGGGELVRTAGRIIKVSELKWSRLAGVRHHQWPRHVR